MNNDHQRELSHYLRHWARLAPRAAAKPELVDISFKEMIIRTHEGTRHAIPIKPPMRSWADARTRAVDMDREARRKLGLSEIAITEFRSPGLLSPLVMIAALTIVTLSATQRPYITPGTWYYDRVLAYVPGGPDRFLQGLARALPIIWGLHIFEASYMVVKMAKHDVVPFSKLWFQWVGYNLIEGFPSKLTFHQHPNPHDLFVICQSTTNQTVHDSNILTVNNSSAPLQRLGCKKG